MSDYTGDYTSALADVQAAGSAVTFSPVGGAFTPGTGVIGASAVSAVSGYAISSKNNPLTYARLSLSEAEAQTLFFVPSTYGAAPALASTVSWGGVTYAVKDVATVAPNGTAIAARVVIGR